MGSGRKRDERREGKKKRRESNQAEQAIRPSKVHHCAPPSCRGPWYLALKRGTDRYPYKYRRTVSWPGYTRFRLSLSRALRKVTVASCLPRSTGVQLARSKAPLTRSQLTSDQILSSSSSKLWVS